MNKFLCKIYVYCFQTKCNDINLPNKHALQWNLNYWKSKMCWLNMKMFSDITDTSRIYETEWTQRMCFIKLRIHVSMTNGNSISSHTKHVSGIEINKWLYLLDYTPLTLNHFNKNLRYIIVIKVKYIENTFFLLVLANNIRKMYTGIYFKISK